MPTISRFYGITIAIYFNDHAPPRALRLDKGWGILRWPGNRDLAPEALHDLPDEPEASTRRTPRARSRRPARR